ncbi:MAG: hypothetical protein ACJAS9_002350 [Polaribacter sp.]|jgi:hypothetical protein
MKLIYTNENMSLVYSAKNILELNNIDCMLKNEHGNTMGAEFGMANWLELWINNPEEIERAKILIDERVNNPKIKEPWICKYCSEENEGNFQICWNCQK